MKPSDATLPDAVSHFVIAVLGIHASLEHLAEILVQEQLQCINVLLAAEMDTARLDAHFEITGERLPIRTLLVRGMGDYELVEGHRDFAATSGH